MGFWDKNKPFGTLILWEIWSNGCWVHIPQNIIWAGKQNWEPEILRPPACYTIHLFPLTHCFFSMLPRESICSPGLSLSCGAQKLFRMKAIYMTALKMSHYFPCLCPFFFFFFSFIFISWRLITLKYCSGFCFTLTWISHGFTCIPLKDIILTSSPSTFLDYWLVLFWA